MNLFSFVNLLESLQNSLNDICDDVLRDAFEKFLHKFSQASSIHVLNKHEQRLSVVIGEVVLDYIWRLTKLHNSNLTSNFFQGLMILLLHDPNCIKVMGRISSLYLENFTGTSMAKFISKDKILCWMVFDELNFLYFVLKFFSRQ